MVRVTLWRFSRPVALTVNFLPDWIFGSSTGLTSVNVALGYVLVSRPRARRAASRWLRSLSRVVRSTRTLADLMTSPDTVTVPVTSFVRPTAVFLATPPTNFSITR